MADRDKVISRLQIIRTWADVGPSIEGRCLEDIVAWIDDALALLKAQEPVEPITKNRAYFCGNPCCGRILADMVPSGAPTHKIKYCSECGRAVKWE